MTVDYEDNKIKINKYLASNYNNNLYIVTCKKTGEAMVIDAPKNILRVLQSNELPQVNLLAITHGHFDHIEGFNDLPLNIQNATAIHEADSSQLPITAPRFLHDGETLELGKLSLEVLHTPGHTPGGICILVGDHLFSGDTLFPGGPGRTSSPINLQQLILGIKNKLLTLGENTIVYPGHGDNTTIGEAKKEFSVFESHGHSETLCGNVLWLKD
jgi:glyoxylase-like metal-dependent hydrolase (beta-lactamase superfamily II)